jgi:dephospho-CoA kinase
VLLVGLTGGIGAGKSTVARMLEDRGAVVFDADVLARDAVAPGTSGFAEVVRRFGDRVVGPDGTVDRRALASIVFVDDDARRDLEAIVHPEVRRRFADAVQTYRESDAIVVFSVPLLVETGAQDLVDVVVVVSAPVETQIERLVGDRRMSEDQVRARIAAQAPLEDKAAVADVIVDNDGTLEDLRGQVDRLWADLRERAGAPG